MGNIYHSWDGTILTITSDSGTSSADLQGAMGIRGPQGVAGTMPIEQLNNILATTPVEVSYLKDYDYPFKVEWVRYLDGRATVAFSYFDSQCLSADSEFNIKLPFVLSKANLSYTELDGNTEGAYIDCSIVGAGDEIRLMPTGVDDGVNATWSCIITYTGYWR